MQAGFRFVEHHEFRWARSEESCRPQKVAQSSVRQFGCGQGPQQSMLLQLQLETSIPFFYIKAASGEGVLYRLPQCFVRPNLEDRLQSGCKIASVVMKDRRECSNLCCSGGRVGICAKVIVKPPAAKGFADGEHLRGAMWITNTGEHAVCVGKVLRGFTGSSSDVVESQTKLFLRSTRAAAFR